MVITEQHLTGILIIIMTFVIIWVFCIMSDKHDERLTERGRLRERQRVDRRIRESKMQESLRERQRFPCPHCSKLLFRDSSSCGYCKVEFVLEGKSGIPEITKGFRPESFDKRLEPYGLSKERYLEFFESWEHGIVHPAWFLREVIQKYKRAIVDVNEALKHVTLADYLAFTIPLLPKNPLELSDATEQRITSVLEGGKIFESYVFNNRYRRVTLDYCIGGGWLPPHTDCVDITPPHELTSRESVTKFVCENDNSYFHAQMYDEHLLSPLYTNNEGAYDKTHLCCFQIAPSDADNITQHHMVQFWNSLQRTQYPVSFEIVGNGTSNTVAFQFVCHPEDKTEIGSQLAALFPNSNLNVEGNDEDLLISQVGSDVDNPLGEVDACGVSFGLTDHYSIVLPSLTSFDKTDPLFVLVRILAELEKNQGAIIQALVSPLTGLEQWQLHLNDMGRQKHSSHSYRILDPEWVQEKEDWYKYIKDNPINTTVVGDFTIPERYITETKDYPAAFHDISTKEKRSFPLLAVCFRVMAFGKKGASELPKLKSYLDSIQHAISSNKLPERNVLGVEPVDGKVPFRLAENLRIPSSFQQLKSEFDHQELNSIFTRRTHRHGFLLNTQELATLCHFPHKELQHPKLLRQDSTMAKAPEHVTQGDGLLIGVNEVFGQSQQVYVPEDYRFRHMYVVGKTGMGKTTFLLNLIKADIDAGKGVGLIDPHGDLVEEVLRVIPEHRIDDVILFDPSDYEYPIGFNMLQASNAQERRQMRSDILVAIRRLFDDAAWGDNIDQLFRTSINTLLADYRENHTLLDIRRLISDDVFRSQVLRRIDDDYLLEFWRDDFPHFNRTTIAAVRRRLGSIMSEPEVRNILSQQKTSFSFNEIMDTGKIFLAKISRGTLGEDISSLFGNLLVSKIQLVAMARDSQPEHQRVPFYLYVDEFQNFVNEGFEFILSEARKYKLCLTMAHQFTAQLPRPIYNAVFGNVGTLIAFQTGVDDAMVLERQVGKFTKDDILNLESYHTITRIGKASDAFSMKTLPPPENVAGLSGRVREASRATYCRPLDELQEREAPQQQQEEETQTPEIEPESEAHRPKRKKPAQEKKIAFFE